jgi:hypothetical protein
MDKLKKDIEKIISEAGRPGIKIIFAIDNNSQLVQMIEKLYESGYCENKSGWTSNRATAKTAFDVQSSNFIELCTDQKSVTYSTTLKYKDALQRGNKVALKTANYLEKQVRKKLTF